MSWNKRLGLRVSAPLGPVQGSAQGCQPPWIDMAALASDWRAWDPSGSGRVCNAVPSRCQCWVRYSLIRASAGGDSGPSIQCRYFSDHVPHSPPCPFATQEPVPLALQFTRD